MREYQRRKFEKQSGFTLMEIIVATAIFVTVVSSIMALFVYVLRINRRVQAVRQVAQGSRNFTEILSREIRNGRIDYNSPNSKCSPANYPSPSNQAVAISTYDGIRTCIYLDLSGQLNVERLNQQGTSSSEVINPPGFTINTNNFRFIIRPSTDPTGPSNKEIQPMVTILAEFQIYLGQRDQQIIPYQTTISTDVYDIPHAP